MYHTDEEFQSGLGAGAAAARRRCSAAPLLLAGQPLLLHHCCRQSSQHVPARRQRTAPVRHLLLPLAAAAACVAVDSGRSGCSHGRSDAAVDCSHGRVSLRREHRCSGRSGRRRRRGRVISEAQQVYSGEECMLRGPSGAFRGPPVHCQALIHMRDYRMWK